MRNPSPGLENLPGDAVAHPFLNDLGGVRGGENRDGTIPAENVDPARVISVFVGQEDPSDTVGVDPKQFEPKLQLPGAETRVDQDACVFRADNRAVTGTSAA